MALSIAYFTKQKTEMLFVSQDFYIGKIKCTIPISAKTQFVTEKSV